MPGYDARVMHPELQEAIDLHRDIIAEAGNALVGYDTEKALANVVLLSEIPDHVRQGPEAAGQCRQPAPARRSRRRQDVLRRHPRRHQQREVRTPPGPRRPAADRDRRLSDDQPRHRRAGDRVRSARLGRNHPARRDQPHSVEVAERLPRRAAGPHGHRRQGHLRAAAVQFCHRDDEPGRARAGDLSAVGGGDRSLRDHDQRALSARPKRKRGW